MSIVEPTLLSVAQVARRYDCASGTVRAIVAQRDLGRRLGGWAITLDADDIETIEQVLRERRVGCFREAV